MQFYKSACLLQLFLQWKASAFSIKSSFIGESAVRHVTLQTASASSAKITMRKQKASDKRTRRMQRGQHVLDPLTDALSSRSGITPVTPMSSGAWSHKEVVTNQFQSSANREGGRGRSRKRSIVYSSLSSYHNHFLELLTAEFLAEVRLISFLSEFRLLDVPCCLVVKTRPFGFGCIFLNGRP